MGGRRIAAAALAAGAATALVAGASVAGTVNPLPDRLHPPVVATSFQATAVSGANRERLSWRVPEWWAQRRLTQAAFVGDVVERLGTTTWAPAASFPGRVERNTFAARPDARSQSLLLSEAAEFLLAEARAGKRVLKPALAGRTAAWRGAVHVRANDCAGLRAGTRTVWLDRRTLLPLRVSEQRGGRRFSTSYAYTRIAAPLPANTFGAPRVRPRHERVNYGFRRTAPAHASGPLSYIPLLPTALPPRFELAVSGWAPRSSRTGAEGSIAPRREVFAAVYRRGFERIDVTQRLAGGRGWPGDPFGAECVFQFEQPARVNGLPARYGAGPDTVPHLYWRAGRLLHTVSGPYPRSTLVDIAQSLRPLGT